LLPCSLESFLMKFKYLLASLILLGFYSAKSFPLSEQSRIFLITAGPDNNELYAAFGHSAIRVFDPVNNIDLVFNYGTFDFDQPNFYLNFAMGRPYYFLSDGAYGRFQYAYIYYNRWLKAQQLNLTLDERQSLYDFLQWNLRPENQFYVYDYFYDNCSTRIWDILKKVFPDRVAFDSSYLEKPYTFRQLVDLYTADQQWGDLGINICLGLPMDKTLRPSDYMFLPDYLFQTFAHGTIQSGDSIKPLVARTFSIYESAPEEVSSNIGPKAVFWSLLLIVIILTLWEILKRRHFKIVDVILFGSVWLLSLFLLFLWFGTNHKSSWNFNLLWANPFHIVFLYFMIKERRNKLVIIHFVGYGILQLLVLIFWNVLPQHIHTALVPVVIALALRSFWIYRFITSKRSWASE